MSTYGYYSRRHNTHLNDNVYPKRLSLTRIKKQPTGLDPKSVSESLYKTHRTQILKENSIILQ